VLSMVALVQTGKPVVEIAPELAEAGEVVALPMQVEAELVAAHPESKVA